MKSKSALRLCLSLFICFALLIGSQSFLQSLLTLYPEWFCILFHAVSMFIPIVLLHLLMPRKEVFRPKLKPSHISAEMLSFTLCAGLSITFARFILDYLPGSVVLCGAKRPAQITSNMEGSGWKLKEEDIKKLDEVSR